MNILQVGTTDTGGGAEKVVWSLFQCYRSRGHGSWLAVGRKTTDDSDVLLIPNDEARESWSRFFSSLNNYVQQSCGKVWSLSFLCSLLFALGEPMRWLDQHRGVEDFHFPGTRHILKISPRPPDILHLHNLHGGYFDLRVLPWLSQQVPVVLTLHDAWLLSGHCAHSFDCERWRTGCGHCPDLKIYPAISRDATAWNWQRKGQIYNTSRLNVAAPSRWLMQKVEQSMLGPAMAGSRVVPNGVDLSVFRPGDRQKVRAELQFPENTNILLFTANRIQRNIWKDYSTIRTAIAQVADRTHGKKLLLIALGEDAPAGRLGAAEVRFVPYQRDAKVVARYYQAADIYIHAARAEVWGLTITEALACGTPVIATAVGGITEQVRGLDTLSTRLAREWNRYNIDEATGILVPAGDSDGMACAIQQLLTDDTLRLRLGENAAKDAHERFDVERQAASYLQWYAELLAEKYQRAV